jgi:hypothetical protein
MKSIETAIIINVSVAKVWEILTKFETYPNWNPFIKSVKGNIKKGETIEVKIQLEGMKLQTFTPEILVFNINKEFRWLGELGIKGIFDGEHFFILERIDNERTKLIHGERFTGILSGLIYKMIGKKTKNGFNAMNQAIVEVLNIKN